VRVFLDANVLFSAARSNGAIRELLALLLETGHAGVVDGFVVEEARRNLMLPAKGGGPTALAALAEILARLEVAPVHAHDLARAELSGIAEKDRPVLAAAIALRCDALVTGDRTHFGSLWGRTRAGVAIFSPRLLAERLLPERRPSKERSRPR